MNSSNSRSIFDSIVYAIALSKDVAPGSLARQVTEATTLASIHSSLACESDPRRMNRGLIRGIEARCRVFGIQDKSWIACDTLGDIVALIERTLDDADDLCVGCKIVAPHYDTRKMEDLFKALGLTVSCSELSHDGKMVLFYLHNEDAVDARVIRDQYDWRNAGLDPIWVREGHRDFIPASRLGGQHHAPQRGSARRAAKPQRAEARRG